jgi:hypothetical protein
MTSAVNDLRGRIFGLTAHFSSAQSAAPTRS